MPAYLLLLFLVATVVLGVLFTPRVFRRPLSPVRRFWLGVLQLVPLLILVWLMGNPTTNITHRESLKRIVAVLVDDSPSMAFEDGESGRSRYETAKSWAEELTEQWKTSSRSTELVTLQFTDLVTTGQSPSDFSAVLDGLTKRIPKDRLAEVIIASDGQDHGDRSPSQAARQLGIPVHTLGLGPLVSGEDIQARWLETPETAIPGSPFMVRWGIHSSQSGSWTGRVHITAGSREILHKEISLQPGKAHLNEWASVTLENSGKHLLRLLVESSRTAERVAQATATVTVEQTTPTLLILEHELTRLTQSLSQAVLQGGRYRVIRFMPAPDDGGGVRSDLFRPTLGESRDQPWLSERVHRMSQAEWESALRTILPGVSVVVLGRSKMDSYPEEWISVLDQHLQHNRSGVLILPGAETITERLQQGGLKTLITWTGRRKKSFQPIDLVFPSDAQNHPAMAPVWMMINQAWKVGPDESFESPPPYARVLMMDMAGNPLLFESNLNLSRAVTLSLSDLWTLGTFDTSRTGGERRFLEGLWLGMVDYLAAGAGKDSVQIHVFPNPAPIGQAVQVIVEDPSLRPGPVVSGTELRKLGEATWKTLPLGPDPEWAGIGRASWVPREEGSYEIRYASGEEGVLLRVLPYPPEPGDRLQNPDTLSRIATTSGGKYASFSNRDHLIQEKETPPLSVVRSESVSFRHHLLTGIVLALLFCTGWGIRRLLSLP